MTKGSDNDFPSILITEQAVKPTAPAAGKQRLYMKTDHKLYHEDSGGTETEVGGASGDVATDAIWDAAGDLAVGTGANTAAKLTKGTALQGLRVKSDASTLEYAAHAMDIIQTITAGVGGIASFDFTSIPGTYKNLEIHFQGRSDQATTAVNLRITMNNDGGNNYDYEQVYTSATSAPSAAEGIAGAFGLVGNLTGANAPSGSAGAGKITIPDYAGTTFHKNALATAGHSQSDASAGTYWINTVVRWRNTAAITRITLTPSAGSLIQGSTATLYGLNG